MKKTTRRLSRTDSQNFWPSFTDIMSGMVLILFFVLVLLYINNCMKSGQLSAAEKALGVAVESLDDANDQLANSNLKAEELQGLIDTLKENAALSEEEYYGKTMELQAALSELEKLRGDLQEVALLRLSVYEKIVKAIEDEMGTKASDGNPLISIENSQIVINESLVFDVDSYAIRSEAYELLDCLANAFVAILSDSQVGQYINAIVIEGHTDDTGSDSYNRDLSAKRSVAVLDYLCSSNSQLSSQYQDQLVATAYGQWRPISDGSSEASRAQNRRIGVSIIVKDESIASVIEKYLKSQ